MKYEVRVNGEVVFEANMNPGDKLSFNILEGDGPKVMYHEKELALFDQVRKAYPGKKRGSDTEFNNFRKRHKDWKDELPKLLGAIEAQLVEKKVAGSRGQFVPEWPMFSVWINQRRWEMEVSKPVPVNLNREINFKRI